MKRKTSQAGKLAENLAVKYLTSKGYKIIERNFRSRFGEIDVISIKDNSLIFSEVKARWNLNFGTPEESVTPSKIRKITRTAEYFSLIHPGLPKNLRIEVVALYMTEGKPVETRIITVE